MADGISASIHPLHQPQTKRPKTAAERAKAYRERKKGANLPAVIPASVPAMSADVVQTQPILTPAPMVSRKKHLAPALLTLAALALAGTGIVMNGMFAMSLGSTDYAGWLFLALGLASDVAALAIPSCAARFWQDGERGTAMAGWLIWATVFAFALLSGLGFASVNIADVTASRASRVTPAVASAQTALADAMAARDRECRSGTGKFCRERETAVTDVRRALDAAIGAVAQTADPQADAAIRMTAWLTRGNLRPTSDDFAMLRLCLISILPQIGGVLLMVAGGRR